MAETGIADLLVSGARSASKVQRRVGTTPCARSVPCWSRSARSTRATWSRCSSGSSRCPRTSGEGVAIPHGTLAGRDLVLPRRAVRACSSRRRRLGRRRRAHLRRHRRRRRRPRTDTRPARRAAHGPGARRRPCATRPSVADVLASPDPGGGFGLMLAARFHAPGDVRLEDVPEPAAGSGRRHDPGPDLLHLRHRREDLPARPPPHRPAAHHGPRDRRRDRRGRRATSPAGRRATGCR